MLVTMKEILDDARARHYGVGMFNAFNVEMALGVMDAAEALLAPVIIGTAEGLLHCCDMDLAVQMLRCIARRAKVPTALHLDHGFTPKVVRKAIETGFTSVMYDMSEASYEQNVAGLKDMAQYAHSRGVSIEGELGHVVFDTAEDTGYAYTRPEEVVDFVGKTHVDALAISIGTAHGVYKQRPVLDLERLKKIRENTQVNLVLHGGSGLSDDDFRNVVRDGIQKINIYTDVSYQVTRAAHDLVEKNVLGVEAASVAMRQAAREAALQKLRLFGCADKA